MTIIRRATHADQPSLANEGLGVVWTEQHSGGLWYAAVYWRQLPGYPHQGTDPIRYALGAFGETEAESVAKLRAELGLTVP